MELERYTAAGLGRLVGNGEISPTEVIRYFAERIEERDPSLHAFTYLKIEEALNDAKKLEDQLARREQVGPFAGVPIALKDFLPSKKGWTNSHGGVAALIMEDAADSSFYAAAAKAGADVYVTGDLKYHQGEEAAALDLCLIDAGHFDTEVHVIEVFTEKMAAAMPGIRFIVAEKMKNCWHVL